MWLFSRSFQWFCGLFVFLSREIRKTTNFTKKGGSVVDCLVFTIVITVGVGVMGAMFWAVFFGGGE